MTLSAHAQAALDDLAARGLLRNARSVESPQSAEMRVDGRTVLCFCSNNYLGLADDPALLEAARLSLEQDGLGSGASRLVSGSMDAHRAAEERLARYLEEEAAILFSTGYTANVGTLQTLLGPDDIAFSDALNHASLIDGLRLSRARVHVYRHSDPDDLERLLRAHRAEGRRALVVSDAVFSMDGDLAPLAELRALADRYQADLVVDEAHALGVLGPRGQGACAALGVRADVRIGTLGKSFGAAGAFTVGSAAVVALLRNRARSYVFSTAPVPLLGRVAVAAADLVEAADARREALRRHGKRLRAGLREQGYEVPDGETPIVPVLVGDARETMSLSAALFERGVFAQGIRPPTVPQGTSRIRLVPMATHTDAHVTQALEAFEDARRSLHR